MGRKTAYIEIDPAKCVACWDCVNACAKKALGKVNLIIHKHSRVKNAKACVGCKKCVKVCQHGAIISIADPRTK